MSADSPLWAAPSSERLEGRLSIEKDGTIIARSGKVEYGQGIRTGFARIVARELSVPIERVRVQLGETDQVPWDMGTFGSMSTATDGQRLREAAIFARTCLLQRASERWAIAAHKLRLHNGTVLAPDGKTISYPELIGDEGLTGTVPQAPGRDRLDEQIKEPSRDVPETTHRLEARDIVLGRPRFSSDVRLPGMLRGSILRPPIPGAALEFIDADAARSLPGVKGVVRDGDFVGIVAQRDSQAAAGVAALAARWGPAPSDEPSPPETTLWLRRDEGTQIALDSAKVRFRARYHVPYIAHAAIAPSAAVADVRTRDAHLYVATQRPFGLREEISCLLKLPLECVHVHPQAMGGMFGRGTMNDAAIEAARLSHAAGHPVLLQWTRSEEFRLSPHRPTLDAQVEASLDASGAIAAWHYRTRTNPHIYGRAASLELLAMTSGRNAIPPYRVGCAEVLLEVVPAEVRTGALRSLAAAPNVFAIESFIDEIALGSSQDPIAFRLRHLQDVRLRRVLETVRERSGWSSRKQVPGIGFGVACATYHGTHIAQVVRIRVTADVPPRLERVWCVVDPGEVIWPEGARSQIEGAIQQAASWSLLERLEYSEGRVTTATFHDYPIARCPDAPDDIEVLFVTGGAEEPTGLGEPGAVPLAAAIANALCDATGIRYRSLPLGSHTARSCLVTATETGAETH